MDSETNIPNFSMVRKHGHMEDERLLIPLVMLLKEIPFRSVLRSLQTKTSLVADSSFPRTEDMHIIPNLSRRLIVYYQHQQMLRNNWAGASNSSAWFPHSYWMRPDTMFQWKDKIVLVEAILLCRRRCSSRNERIG